MLWQKVLKTRHKYIDRDQETIKIVIADLKKNQIQIQELIREPGVKNP
jgi:hypothetical protein